MEITENSLTLLLFSLGTGPLSSVLLMPTHNASSSVPRSNAFLAPRRRRPDCLLVGIHAPIPNPTVHTRQGLMRLWRGLVWLSKSFLRQTSLSSHSHLSALAAKRSNFLRSPLPSLAPQLHRAATLQGWKKESWATGPRWQGPWVPCSWASRGMIFFLHWSQCM